MVNVIRLGNGSPVIRLGVPTISKQIERIPTFLKAPIVAGRILASPRLTPFLAGTLAGLLGGPGVGARTGVAVKTFFGTGLGIGVLAVSPKAREFVKTKILDPGKSGRGIGGIIEDPSQLLPKDKPVKEKIVDTLKTAGVIGGLAAAGVGAGVLTKKAIDKFKKPKVPSAIAGLGLPVAPLPTIQQPLGAAVRVPEEAVIEDKPVKAAPTMPSIKNTFNPSINISFRKTRRFINQQIIVK